MYKKHADGEFIYDVIWMKKVTWNILFINFKINKTNLLNNFSVNWFFEDEVVF